MSGGGSGVGGGDHDRRDQDQGQRVDGSELLLPGCRAEILRQAEATDRHEDEVYGEDRGDELPEQLRTPERRRQALADAKQRIEERNQREITAEVNDGAGVDIDPERSFRRKGGRREWLRLARRDLEAHRERQAAPIPRDRDARLFEAARQLEQNQQVEVAANDQYELREGKRSGWDRAVYEQMREKLGTDRGRRLYAQRTITIEPVFGQIKYNRRIDQFMRRGRATARSEWRLAAATHNLLKLHSHWIATPA